MDDNESFSTTPSSADGIKVLAEQQKQSIPVVVATSSGISNDNATIASPPPPSPGVAVVPYWVKIVSGSIGSMVTAFAVTPLEVVKVRQQSQQVTTMPTTSINTNTIKPSNVTLCPRGCGTFVFNNGLGECLLPKSAVPYFGTAACTTPTTNRKPPNLNTTMKPNSSAMNDGTFQMIRRIFATEGLAGIYAGLAPTLVMGVPNTVLYFVTYEELATRLRNYHQSSFDNHNNNIMMMMKLWSPAVAGGAARFIASTSTAPLELIRTRQAARIGSDIHANKGMIEEITYIIRKEGFPALYNGLSPTLWRDVPFSAIYWLGIERMREEWRIYHRRNNNNHQQISTFQQAYQGLINGSISGMVAAFCTTPLDVIKTRRQTEFIQINTNAVILEEAAVVAAAASSSATAATATAAATLCDHEGAVVYNPSSSSTTTRGGTTGNSTSATTTATTTRSSQPQQPSKPRGTIHMMKDIFVEEGISGLWKGNQARMFKVAPACAIMISSYEVGKRILSPSEEA